MKISSTVLIVLVLIASAATGLSAYLFDKWRSEKTKKEQVQKIAFEETEKYKSKYNTEVAKNYQWQLSYKDIKNIAEQQDSRLTTQERLIKKLTEQVDGMNIPLKRIDKAISAGFTIEGDSTMIWKIDSLIKNKKVRTAELNEGSLQLKITDYGDSLNIKRKQQLSIYAALYSTRTWKSGKEIKYPGFVFWKKWELKGAVTTSDSLIKIDTVLFLDRVK